MSYSQSEIVEIIDTQNKSKERQYGRTIGIHNKKRTGKTLLGVMLSDYYMQNLDYIDGLITNVDVYKKKFTKKCVPFETIKEIKDYRKYVLFTDEFRDLCDSRMSSSYKNLFISNILKDTGKFQQIHLITDQEASSIDKRIRNNADAVLRPQIDFKTGICTVKVVPSYNSYFKLDAYEEWDDYDVEFYFEFRKYYDYYNTEQHIEPYYIEFTPDDYVKLLMDWIAERKYDKIENLTITKGVLILWKKFHPQLYLSNDDLTALLTYIKLETDLKTTKHEVKGKRR